MEYLCKIGILQNGNNFLQFGELKYLFIVAENEEQVEGLKNAIETNSFYETTLKNGQKAGIYGSQFNSFEIIKGAESITDEEIKAEYKAQNEKEGNK